MSPMIIKFTNNLNRSPLSMLKRTDLILKLCVRSLVPFGHPGPMDVSQYRFPIHYGRVILKILSRATRSLDWRFPLQLVCISFSYPTSILRAILTRKSNELAFNKTNQPYKTNYITNCLAYLLSNHITFKAWFSISRVLIINVQHFKVQFKSKTNLAFKNKSNQTFIN